MKQYKLENNVEAVSYNGETALFAVKGDDKKECLMANGFVGNETYLRRMGSDEYGKRYEAFIEGQDVPVIIVNPFKTAKIDALFDTIIQAKIDAAVTQALSE